MKPSTLAILISCLLGTAICPPNAVAGTNARKIVLISGPKERIDIARLRDTIDAHMSDLGAVVTVRAVMDMPLDLETQMDVARALLRENSARAAVWIETETDTLMVLVQDHASEQILDRPLSAEAEQGDQIYDAAAAIVRATLTPWFSDEEPAESAPPIRIDVAPKPPQSDAEEVTPLRIEHGTRRSPQVRATLFAAYTLVANLDGRLANGGAMGAGLALFQRLFLGVDLRLLQAASMQIPETRIRLFRLPLSIKAALTFETGPVALGFQAGLTFDIARVMDAEKLSAPRSVQRTRMGFSPGGLIRFLATEWISLDLLLTVDIFYEPVHYVWNDTVVLTNEKVQPNGMIGLFFYLPPPGREEKLP